jgi:prephenate dehydrogenase
MPLFKRVAIVGTGLIGGSLGQAIKSKRLAAEVVGVSRRRKSLLLAKKSRAIDTGSQDIRIIRGADLVILATPVGLIMNLAPQIAKIIGSQTIVTDVGSTKKEIVAKLSKIFPRYIGSHPLAGSEKRGIAHAEAGLFKNSLCILTPHKNADCRAKIKLRVLWNKLGARVVFLSPSKHDEILSFISHLPHAAAFSLIGTVPQRYLSFASAGLKDTTRIAASDSVLWGDVFLSNRKNIVRSINLLQRNLSRLKAAIQRKDKVRLLKILREAKARRESLQ